MISRRPIKQQYGISLIIVFFMLVLAGSISLYSIQAAQAKFRQLKTDKTVLEVTQILEAGMLYFNVHQEWPTSLSDLVAGKFLPQGSDSAKNPWSLTDTYEISSTWNDLTVRANLTSAGPAVASEVAARLPSGEVSPGSTLITAKVLRPGKRKAIKDPTTGKYDYALGGYIKSVGTLYLKVKLFGSPATFTLDPGECSEGYEPSYDFALQSVETPKKDCGTGYHFAVRRFIAEPEIPSKKGRQTFKYEMQGTINLLGQCESPAYGRAHLSYIEMCIPKGDADV